MSNTIKHNLVRTPESGDSWKCTGCNRTGKLHEVSAVACEGGLPPKPPALPGAKVPELPPKTE